MSEENALKSIEGATITQVEGAWSGSERVVFTLSDGRLVTFYHDQDCCESVDVEDVLGDVDNLIGSPLILAEEIVRDDPKASESGTKTWYTFVTSKGSVVIRWYGASNGYYSESVNIRISGESGQLYSNHLDCDGDFKTSDGWFAVSSDGLRIPSGDMLDLGEARAFHAWLGDKLKEQENSQ